MYLSDTLAPMDLMQLKAPPERVAKIADAIERDIEANPDYDRAKELTQVLTWLRHRLAKWEAQHPTTAAG